MDSELADAWGDWIAGCGPWHVFGALTYDQERPSRRRAGVPTAPPRDVALAHVRRWLRDSDRATSHRLEAAVVALEFQKNGWPHFHPLLRLAGGLRPRDFERAGQTWFRPHGYARLEIPQSEGAVAAYAAKYLTKDLSRGDVVFWPLRGSWSAHQPRLGSRS